MHEKELEEKARWLRINVLETGYQSKKGHIGGTFSCIDILVALYYGGILNVNPQDPNWGARDRLVIGKGHACLAVYYILSDLGFFPAERIEKYGTNGSTLGGQLNIDTPGIEYSTGSLGNALGVSAGMALAAQLDNKPYKVYVLIGDGECSEGSVWESVAFAAKHNLNNLIGIIDCNKLSVIGCAESNIELENKFKVWGWNTMSVNGHSYEELLKVLKWGAISDKPFMILANTIKGKGVSFFENDAKWHNQPPSKEEFERAGRELHGH